jgi:hypothetical protein
LREVTYTSRGAPARGYAKWLVQNFTWSELSPLLRSKRVLEAFIKSFERPRNSEVIVPLRRAIDAVYLEALKFYRQNRGTGEAQLDISTFFKNRKNLHTTFAKDWKASRGANQKRFQKGLQRMHAKLVALAEC